MPTVECFYTLSSPWAYFGGPRLAEIAAKRAAKVILRPFDFQAVVPANGGIPIRTRPDARRAYHDRELARWSALLGMPIHPRPEHYPRDAPMDNRAATRAVIAAQRLGLDAQRLSHAILRALWAEQRDTKSVDTIAAIAAENAMAPVRLFDLSLDAEVAREFESNSARALELGVFGSPTYVVNGDPFWGQDRLEFVDRALAAG